jgi:hypothetical protein
MISESRWRWLLDTRATRPGAVAEALASRRRRPLLGDDGRLMLVAADHPARGMLAVGDRLQAMASRRDLLDRLIVALDRPGVDGVLASPDIVDDLALLGELDDLVVIGTMNRAGLKGARWELDDRMSAYSSAELARQRLDGGKMLLRLDDDDAGTLTTIEQCARAVGELAEHHLPAMIEPLPYRGGELDPTTEKLVRAATVAAALGPTSAYTWLKLPAAADVEAVMAATSLPVLVLGGDPGPDRRATYESWACALAQPSVRGLLVGRAVLYPPDDDVAVAIDDAVRLVRPAGG